jgi:hypothetical protein
MFFATTNPGKRLLLLNYVGHVTVDELRRGREESSELMSGLKPGFTVLADMERLESMSTDCAPEMGKLMELCEEKGVETVVRVIPHPSKDIGLNIIGAFHYRNPPKVIACETMEEALAALKL